MAAPQKKVAVKKTASKKKVSGEFKGKSGSSPKKVKAFKKPDLIVKQKSISKKLLGAGLGLFASGAIAGTLAASLLKKKSVVANAGSEGANKQTPFQLIQEMTQNNSSALQEAESKSLNLQKAIQTNLEIIKTLTTNKETNEKDIVDLKDQLKKSNERTNTLSNDLENSRAQIEGYKSLLSKRG